MDIREIDIADDASMAAMYGVDIRSSHLGRESMPQWTLQEFLGAYRSGDSGERQVVLGAYDGDTLLGFCASGSRCWTTSTRSTSSCTSTRLPAVAVSAAPCWPRSRPGPAPTAAP